MRRQRLGLVQTADQLRFSYIAVLQGALQDMELEPSNYEDLVDQEDREVEDEEEVETDDSELRGWGCSECDMPKMHCSNKPVIELSCFSYCFALYVST